MKKLKNQNAITLIALIITIIILLILAGISISALTQTGLFSRAKQAEQKSKEAEQNQTTTLGTYEKEINKYVAEELTSDKVDKVLSITENIILKDLKGNVFIVPAGFKVKNDATTVDKGIIIEDATETTTKGSQFVWVPVGTITKADGTTVKIKLDRYTFADDDNATPTAQGDKAIDTYYKELENSDKGNTVVKSITNFKNSVAINGGYYIGRYEARQNSLNTDSIAITGTIDDKQCNIYDMASNVREFTTETCSSSGDPCVNRGGYYKNSTNYTSGRYLSKKSSAREFVNDQEVKENYNKAVAYHDLLK